MEEYKEFRDEMKIVYYQKQFEEYWVRLLAGAMCQPNPQAICQGSPALFVEVAGCPVCGARLFSPCLYGERAQGMKP